MHFSAHKRKEKTNENDEKGNDDRELFLNQEKSRDSWNGMDFRRDIQKEWENELRKTREDQMLGTNSDLELNSLDSEN